METPHFFRALAGLVATAILAAGIAPAPAQAASAAPARAIVPAASTLLDYPRDFTGDRNSDLLARDSRGELWIYPGNGYGGFLPRRKISGGWNNMSAIITGHFTAGRHNDIVARDRKGNLWLYAGNGHATFKHPVEIGSGWNAFTMIQDYGFTYSNLGVSAILVRDRSGVLWNYRFNRSAGHFYRPARLAGGGWNQYVQIVNAGDFSGDSNYGDLLARDRSGRYWVYAVDPYGTFYPREELTGTGPRYSAVVCPWDWDGKDGRPNIMGIDSHGDLWQFSLTVKPRRVGHGFSGYTLV